MDEGGGIAALANAVKAVSVAKGGTWKVEATVRRSPRVSSAAVDDVGAHEGVLDRRVYAFRPSFFSLSVAAD